MKKENKVISLKLAKELKEIASINNFELPESEYYWSKEIGIIPDDKRKWRIMTGGIIEQRNEEWYSAYDTSELGEILPLYYCSHRENGSYRCFGGKEVVKSFEAETEAEARGLCLLYLIKNKLI